MFYVYIIKSINYPSQIYIGYTMNIEARFKDHNNGSSWHTAKYMPWELIAYFAFPDKSTALTFEHYLKSGSGKAFTKKHLF